MEATDAAATLWPHSLHRQQTTHLRLAETPARAAGWLSLRNSPRGARDAPSKAREAMATRVPLHEKATAAGYGTLPDAPSEGVDPAVSGPGPETASLWSRLFFTYATPLMETGNARQLEADDLWDTTDGNRAQHVYATFKTAFNGANGSILRAIVRAYGTRLLLCGLGTLLTLVATLFAPVVLHHVIDSFTAPVVDLDDLTVWLACFFTSRVLSALATSQVGFHTEQLAIRLTVSMRTMLFEKALRRQSKSKTSTTKPEAEAGDEAAPPADLSNLFTADIDNVLWAAYQINQVWTLPLQIGGVVYLLYGVLGVAAFAGLVVIFLSIFAGGYLAKLSGQAFGAIMVRKDARMKLIKEVFGAIQIIKLNAWESKFTDKILKLREHELEAVWRTFSITAYSSFMLWGSPLLVSISSFGVYTLVMHKTLTAAKVFTSMALFASIRAPLTTLPRVLGQCIQANIALGRMQEFMTVDEYDETNVIRDGSAYPADVAVDVKNGSFGWTKDQPLLKNVNISVKKGDLVVIHGSVGAGKSSLCSALLGETDKLSGSVFVRGRVAYYSQQTWIQNMTIRENILFGKAYDEKTYQRVLDACGLVSDIAGFPAGDSTEIGQKGVNLSGGQKARLCLARACYSDADVLILDSPLAAVDAVVQSEIFSKCLCGLLEKKTVVLVTHAPDIIASEAANYKLEVVDGVVSGERREPVKPRSAYATRVKVGKDPKPQDESAASDTDTTVTVSGKLGDDEERNSGRVSGAVYARYFEALGGVKSAVVLMAILLSWQASQVASDLWLSHWTGQKSAVYDESATEYNMAVYSVLCAVSACLVLARSMSAAVVSIKAARYLFAAMTRSLLKAPLRFFDENPIGRIVNRYGDDINAVDFMLPMGTLGVLSIAIFIVAQLGTAIVTVKLLGVLVLPLVYIYIRTTNFYLGSSREISRLSKVSTSPVLTFVTGTEEGAATIRAFGPEYVAIATQHTIELLDANTRVLFAQNVFAEWFELRIQLVGCGVIIVIVTALVYLHEALSPGIVGLAFAYTLNVQFQLLQLVGIWSFLENSMVSPERILEYAAIPPEGDAKLLQIEPAEQWPQQGTINFDNVVFSYKPGAPAVLKGLSFSIKNNEKIGIVGRTGAGKSSLTLALFRINELVSGSVSIDGVDISTMPLQALRSRLSIIPQAPVLFKGPLRAYMDPFEDYSDAEIWEAFEKVEMKEQIEALEGQLAYELSENGENFSVGERQMLCMARAMLTKSRIVVMDEATASIDHATEKKLQHMINRDFQQATVLTIAHRLATVLDSDRIMVLSDGRVVEFDSPRNLVKYEDGMFYELAKEGGVLDKILVKKK